MEGPLGIGAGRQKTLQSIKEKDRLAPINDPNNIAAVIEAVSEIAIPRVLSPPQKSIERIESVYSNLPDEAKPHYVRDERLLRRINAARRQFNDWMGALLKKSNFSLRSPGRTLLSGAVSAF